MKYRIKHILIFILLFCFVSTNFVNALSPSQVVKIVAIKNISVIINQGDAYSLPKTVKATMSNKTTKDVAVKWNKSKIDTTKSGNYVFEGTVKDFKSKVILKITVKPVDKISLIENISIEIKQNQNYKLPKTIKVKLADGTIQYKPVTWDSDKTPTDKIGNYKYSGMVAGYKGKVTLTLIVKPIILRIDDLTINAHFGEVVDFPKTVTVIMSDDSKQEVPVQWNAKLLDTEKLGIWEYFGKVRDYDGLVRLNLKTEYLLTNYEDCFKYFVKLPTGSYDEKEVENIKKRISLIPLEILKTLVNNGITLKLTNGPITDEPEMASLKGVTPRGWEATGLTWDDIPGVGGNPIIIRIGYSASGMGHGSYCLELHETAHIIDWAILYKTISDTEEFQSIWKSEVSNLFIGNDYYNSYLVNYSSEYFAETFVMYYYSSETREKLRTLAPKTYEFMKNLEDFNKKTSLKHPLRMFFLFNKIKDPRHLFSYSLYQTFDSNHTGTAYSEVAGLCLLETYCKR